MGEPEGTVWKGLFWMMQLFICVNAVAKSFLQEGKGRLLYFYTIAGPRDFILSKLMFNALLMLLMSLDEPGPDVRRAVAAGSRWFEAAKLTGIRHDRVGGDKVVVKDPAAPPLWARFYEIGTNRPFFCGRDGVKKYDLAEIEPERRNGYSWYGEWGKKVAAAYAGWAKKWPGT